MPGDLTSPSTFPYTQNALIKALPTGNAHVIFMAIDPSGANLGYSTSLGGSGDDRALRAGRRSYWKHNRSGLTSSQDFPTKNPAQTWPEGATQIAFLTKFSVNGVPWTGSLMLLLLAD